VTVRVVLPALLLCVCAASWAAPAAWSTPTRIANGLEYGLATSGPYVYTVSGTNGVAFRRGVADLQRGAIAWDRPLTLAAGKDTLVALDRPVVASASNVYVFYIKGATTFTDTCCSRTSGDLYFRVVRNNGTAIGPEVRIAASGKVFRVAAAASGSKLFVCYQDFRSGRTWDIYGRFATDDGNTVDWKPEAKIVAGIGPTGAQRPDALMTASATYVYEMDGRETPVSACFGYVGCTQIYETQTSDDATWAPPRAVFPLPNIYQGRPIAARTAAGAMFLAWEQGDAASKFNTPMIARARDAAARWSTPQALLSLATGGSHPFVSANGSTVIEAWHDFRAGQDRADIFARVSTDDGVTFGDEERVTATPGNSLVPMLAYTPGFAHLIYGEFTNGVEVWYAQRAVASAPGRAEDQRRVSGGSRDR
jgi:hypothetical protein